MSRISTAQQFSLTQEHISRAKEKEFAAGEKAASMKELRRPSDSPASYVIAADMKDDLVISETIAKNTALANHVLNATENILSQSQDIMQKIHGLALSASNNASSSDPSRHVLPEVQGLYENLVQALNTQFNQRHLMSGTLSDKAPFDREGNFHGNDSEIAIEVDRGLKMPISLSASKVILGKGVPNGINVLRTVKDLIEGLQANDLKRIRGSLEGFTRATDQLSTGRTELAGKQLEIHLATERQALNGIDRKDAISKIEEADPVKVFSDLARDQTVLKAAMETSRKILNETSVDILFK